MSGGRGGRRPRLVSLGPKLAKGGSADQVGLGVEDVVDDGVGGEDPLGGALALEFLLLPLSSLDDQVGVFHAIVVTQSPGPVAVLAAQYPHRSRVRRQAVLSAQIWRRGEGVNLGLRP
jgi:hypothetical protein